MAGKQSSTKKTNLPQAKTLEVPKVLHIRVNDGIIESLDDRHSPLNLLFRHLHDSMNDKNNLQTLETLAAAHGYTLERGEDDEQ